PKRRLAASTTKRAERCTILSLCKTQSVSRSRPGKIDILIWRQRILVRQPRPAKILRAHFGPRSTIASGKNLCVCVCGKRRITVLRCDGPSESFCSGARRPPRSQSKGVPKLPGSTLPDRRYSMRTARALHCHPERKRGTSQMCGRYAPVWCDLPSNARFSAPLRVTRVGAEQSGFSIRIANECDGHPLSPKATA
ncbi:MAG: hypothetical protein QOI96_1744, partial [Verrucomicrobiota bacterium]